MSEIIGMALAAIGEIAKIAAEAAANAKAAEAELLARLKVVLTTSMARVDTMLARLEVARTAADDKIRAGAPVEVTTAGLPPPPVEPSEG